MTVQSPKKGLGNGQPGGYPQQDPPSAGIRVRGLTKKFGDSVAVDSLDFEMELGEFLVLLGPSGCGKTTTMRCIAGLETPTAGHIAIGDQVVYDSTSGALVPANKRNIGMVFQSYAIWPHMTVAQNVGYPLRMKKLPRQHIKARVDEVLELVGLAGFGDRNASALSGGQMQRVAVARSIIMEPRVLLFDEPLSNLDAKLRDKLRFELRELQQRLNITAIYVTHDQSEALALADRVAVMRDGKFVQLGSPTEIYQRPNSLFVADFVGSGNLLKGKVIERSSAGYARVQLAGSDVVVQSSADPPNATEVTVCLRRESIQVFREKGSGPNVWPATVRVAVFMGNHCSYQLDVGGLELYVESFSGEVLPKGSDVYVTVPPESVLLLGA